MVNKYENFFDGLSAALKEQGASAVAAISISDIAVDERVRLKCQVPVCRNYRKNLMCPPYLPTVAEFREVLKRYSRAVLIQISYAWTNSKADKSSEDLIFTAKKLHDLVNFAEKKAFAEGFSFAAGFIGGRCRLCDECVVVEGSQICRHPFQARPSMEAMGIDVLKTTKSAGWPVTFPITDRVTVTGLVLLD